MYFVLFDKNKAQTKTKNQHRNANIWKKKGSKPVLGLHGTPAQNLYLKMSLLPAPNSWHFPQFWLVTGEHVCVKQKLFVHQNDQTTFLDISDHIRFHFDSQTELLEVERENETHSFYSARRHFVGLDFMKYALYEM